MKSCAMTRGSFPVTSLLFGLEAARGSNLHLRVWLLSYTHLLIVWGRVDVPLWNYEVAADRETTSARGLRWVNSHSYMLTDVI